MIHKKPFNRFQTIINSARSVLLFLVVCSLLFVFGCGKKEKTQEPESNNDSNVTTTPQDSSNATVSQAENVAPPNEDGDSDLIAKLLDPGDEPRTALRYKFRAGQTETMAIEMKMSMAMEMAGQKVPERKMPPTKMTMTIESKEVSPQGDMLIEFKLDKADVIPDPNADPLIFGAMKQSFSSMVGMNGTATITSRGFTRDADIKMPPGANPQAGQTMGNLQQSIEQMSAPLPAEPVGKGARWQTTIPFEANGMKVTQTAIYELVELQGDKVKCNVTVKQTADQQEMNMPGTPPGMKIILESLNTSGSGTMEIMLTDMVPTSNFDMTTNNVILSNNQKMSTTSNIAMKIHPEN